MKPPNTLIVIPAYNEATVIAQVITDLRLQLPATKADIVVIDDGSSDDTARLAECAGAIVVRHIINCGSGAATMTGFEYARRGRYSYIATFDGDGQHLAQDLVVVLARIKAKDSPDLVIGSRLIESQGMSTLKKFGNSGLSAFTKILFGIGVTDSQSGLRALNREACEKINLRTQGYEFCSEMLWRAKQQKLSVTEVPIRAIYSDYSRGKGQSNWNALNIIRALLKHRVLEIVNG